MTHTRKHVAQTWTMDRAQGGFSLIELMITVAIVGVLSALAVPTFVTYIKKARTAEATQGVKRLFDGARAYYLDTPQVGFTPVAPQFPEPSVAITPAPGECCMQGGRCAPDASRWQEPTWQALMFSVNDPHHYSYAYQVSNGLEGFAVRAHGDLDCDGEMSTFEIKARVAMPENSNAGGNGNGNNNVTPGALGTSPAIHRINELE